LPSAELHVLKARLRGGILNKVRRGEYRCPLPTGLVYDEAGNVVLQPDAQIRQTIAYFFETFARVGSARQTVKVFRNEGLTFPSRLRVGDATVFRPLTAWTALRMLNNPRYAGAYARMVADNISGPSMARSTSRESASWVTGSLAFQMLILATSVGSDFKRTSRSSRPTVAHTRWRVHRRREKEPRYCKGRAVCGRCGRHFRIRYATRRGRQEAWYVCDRGHTARGEPNCQSIAGPPIDKAIGLLVTESMTPAAVELALEIRREIEARYEEADQLRCRAIERAQIEAELAQRRFMLVDPSNRLVADTLEREWNEKLRALAEARAERERAQQRDQLVLDDAIRQRLAAMTTDFSRLWDDPSTTVNASGCSPISSRTRR
jgi:hypothetical protein